VSVTGLCNDSVCVCEYYRVVFAVCVSDCNSGCVMAQCAGVIRWSYSSLLTRTGDKSLLGALRGLIASNINQTNEAVGGGAERGWKESVDNENENLI